MKKYLMLCAKIEDTLAGIYRQMANSPNLPGELKQVFRNLANDEDEHSMQLRFAMHFPDGAVIIEKPIDFAPADQLLAEAKRLFTLTSDCQFNAEEAINLGMALEQDFETTHLCNSMEFVNANMKSMFAALAKDDKIHKQTLIEAKVRFL